MTVLVATVYKCFVSASKEEPVIISHDEPCLYHAFLSYNENRRVMDFGYPKYISEDFPGVNTTINAAVHKDGEPV